MQSIIPQFFKPILWSYNVSRLEPKKDKKLLILQAINYGDLEHWRWIARTYGRKVVRDVLATTLASEIRPHARKLAAVVFNINHFNVAPRGVKK